MNNKFLVFIMLGAFFSLFTQIDAGVFPSQQRQNHAPNPNQVQFSNQQSMPWEKEPIASKGKDAQIASKIKDSLQKGSKDYNDTVSFEVEKGRVLLTGQVDSITDIELIEERLNGISEITALDNRIEIRPSKNPETRWHKRDFEQIESIRQRY